MTRHKTFKRKIRTRMEKTSERYSAARRQLLAKSGPDDHPQPESPGAEQFEAQPAGEADTGVSGGRPSHRSITDKTGKGWDDWFVLLDQWGASSHQHGEIAGWLATEHGVPGWWAQSITVAYERERGLRAPGQGRDGKYSISATKTVNVAVERLFEAVADPEIRGRWLTDDALEITTATPEKSVRGRWGDDGSRLAIGFYPKGESKSQIGVAHEQLPDPEAARQAKEYWSGRLLALKELLEA